jgi:ABC-type polysaccharide/polyol phosphate export permease
MVMKFIQARPIEDYSAYLFGIVFLWTFFQTALLDGCISVLANAGLVRKVYFPRAVLPIVSLISNGFHVSIAFGFTLLYFFILGAYPDHLRPVFLMAIPAIFFTAVLALGLSFILAYLNVFYEDVRFIVQALSQLAFYVMPVFFTIEQVAARQNIYPFYMLNPIATLLVTYQRALLRPPAVAGVNGQNLPPVDIPWAYFGLACLTSTAILIFGFRLFEHYKWEISERV